MRTVDHRLTTRSRRSGAGPVESAPVVQRRWWLSPVLLAYVAALALYLVLATVHGQPEPAWLVGLAVGLGAGWLLGMLFRGSARDVFDPLAAAIRGQRRWPQPEVLVPLGVIGVAAAGLVLNFPADAASVTGVLVAWPFGNQYGRRRRTPI